MLSLPPTVRVFVGVEPRARFAPKPATAEEGLVVLLAVMRFTRARERLGRPQPTDAELHRQVTASVRAALREVGGHWDRPTEQSLRDVAAALAARALSWGTPPDVVSRHRREIDKVFARAFAA